MSNVSMPSAVVPVLVYHLSPGKTIPGRFFLNFGINQSYAMSSCSSSSTSGLSPSQYWEYLNKEMRQLKSQFQSDQE